MHRPTRGAGERVRAPAWMWIATVLGCALFVWLGVWQLRRGLEKAAMGVSQAAQPSQPPIVLSRHAPPAADILGVHASASGHYLVHRQMLLDNQSNGERAGYDVLTPLELDDGAIVVVNRGWIARGAVNALPPVPPVDESPRRVLGVWRQLQRPAIRLAGADNCSGGWPRLVEYPTVADLACMLGAQALAGELLLDAGQADGFVRDWRIQPEFPPARHYAYSAQWFGFCAALIALFVRHATRPAREH